jgi:hypothetical protein
MFGYVRPLKAALSEENSGRYQAVYCGLCRVIGKQYGFIAQLFLNYDFAFLAMVLAKEQEIPCIVCRRCPIYPMRKRENWGQDEGLELAATESVILTYWKLRDNVEDSSWGKKLPVWFAAIFLWPAYRKASKRCPSFDRTVKCCLEELRQMECERCASLDRPADAFARILQATSGVDGQAGNEALSQLLYHIGRFIYLIDAWDDLEEDRKNGTYNPILLQYGSDKEVTREILQETMYASLGFAITAYRWMEFGVWTPIVENILTLGLPAMEEAVLSGEWRARKKRIIRRAGNE